MINGRGFFQVEVADDIGGGTAYTRAGNFFRNRDGELVLGNSDGPPVTPAINIPDNASNIGISSDGVVSGLQPGDTDRTEFGQIEIARFINAEALVRVRGNLLIESEATGPAITGCPAEDGNGQLLHKFLESSNVDPIKEYQRIQEYLSWLRVVRASIDALDSGGKIKQVTRQISKPAQTEPKPERTVKVKDIARIKGMSSSALVGMGIVVGLNGTGDGDKSETTRRAMASVVQKLIDPSALANELKNAKNVALITLTADLTSSGIREGDKIDVQVNATAASSLEGGSLFTVPMTEPLPHSPVFAFAHGPITIEDSKIPTTGIVRRGARLTKDIVVKYLDSNGRVTLLLNHAYATHATATSVTDAINSKFGSIKLAVATDLRTIVISVPENERSNPVPFISRVLQTPLVSSSIVPVKESRPSHSRITDAQTD